MKRLTINWRELEDAFDFPSDVLDAEWCFYLDLESGSVVYVNSEIHSRAELISEELDEKLPADAPVTEEAVRSTTTFQELNKYEQPGVLCMFEEQIESGRYTEIPRFSSQQSFQFMEDFVATISDGAIRTELSRALRQRKPFRNFRDAVAKDRRLERAWHEFEAAQKHQFMLEWLKEIGVNCGIAIRRIITAHCRTKPLQQAAKSIAPR